MLYRTHLPLMVLAYGDNHDAAVTIPVGQVFDVIGPATDDRFLVANVSGEEFHVFEADLRERTTLILKKSAKPQEGCTANGAAAKNTR